MKGQNFERSNFIYSGYLFILRSIEPTEIG